MFTWKGLSISLIIIIILYIFAFYIDHDTIIEKCPVSYKVKYEPVKTIEFIERYMECKEWRNGSCISAQINSGQVGYEELVKLQDKERCKFLKISKTEGYIDIDCEKLYK